MWKWIGGARAADHGRASDPDALRALSKEFLHVARRIDSAMQASKALMGLKILFQILAASAVLVSNFLWHWTRNSFDLAVVVGAAAFIASLMTIDPLKFIGAVLAMVFVALSGLAAFFSDTIWRWADSEYARIIVMVGAAFLAGNILRDFIYEPFLEIPKIRPRATVWLMTPKVVLFMGLTALAVVLSDALLHWGKNSYATAIIAVGAAYLAGSVAREVVHGPSFRVLRRRLKSK
jgi:hypothetical protein